MMATALGRWRFVGCCRWKGSSEPSCDFEDLPVVPDYVSISQPAAT